MSKNSTLSLQPTWNFTETSVSYPVLPHHWYLRWLRTSDTLCRWFISSLLTGLIGIHFGFDKGLGVSDEELDEIEREAKETDNE